MTRDRGMSVTQPAPPDGAVERHRIIIIGAGFAGLGAAYRLKAERERGPKS